MSSMQAKIIAARALAEKLARPMRLRYPKLEFDTHPEFVTDCVVLKANTRDGQHGAACALIRRQIQDGLTNEEVRDTWEALAKCLSGDSISDEYRIQDEEKVITRYRYVPENRTVIVP